MPTFDLDADYSASFTPYRHGSGYVEKGTVYYQGKPAELFEVYGDTIFDADHAARAKAQEIHRRWVALYAAKAQKRATEKNG